MQTSCESPPLEWVADIANVVTAIAGVVLAFYIFVYQRKKDSQNNRLQWFKDLIIEPNKASIYSFFETVERICIEFHSPQLTDLRKAELLTALKSECSIFRRHFIALLNSVDSTMETDIQNQIDLLLDRVTEAAFDPSVNLSDDAEFAEMILFAISRVKNYTLSRMFRYEGN